METLPTGADAAPAESGPAARVAPLYQLIMLALCIVALLGVVVQNAFRLDPEIELVLEYADALICIAFAIDFFVSLWTAPNRGRWGRLARVARIARILRGVRAARRLTVAVLQKRSQSTFAAAALLALVIAIASSTAVLHFETRPESNIRTAEDAIWWAFTTITTVGYGDRYPVTSEGRFVAALLMTAGVGLFGAFSAALAAWFLVPEGKATDAEISGATRSRPSAALSRSWRGETPSRSVQT